MLARYRQRLAQAAGGFVAVGCAAREVARQGRRDRSCVPVKGVIGLQQPRGLHKDTPRFNNHLGKGFHLRRWLRRRVQPVFQKENGAVLDAQRQVVHCADGGQVRLAELRAVDAQNLAEERLRLVFPALALEYGGVVVFEREVVMAIRLVTLRGPLVQFHGLLDERLGLGVLAPIHQGGCPKRKHHGEVFLVAALPSMRNVLARRRLCLGQAPKQAQNLHAVALDQQMFLGL
mmetsp:Transcript_5548/g.16856  ORF Transcript_5548/g.16856 Transcript_5548/m.16856 type:complete len:232 (-) Transcript_5548:216-911(-)